jgi:hypothetical protein
VTPKGVVSGAGSQLTALGWLDANTVVEANAAGQLSLYEARVSPRFATRASPASSKVFSEQESLAGFPREASFLRTAKS